MNIILKFIILILCYHFSFLGHSGNEKSSRGERRSREYSHQRYPFLSHNPQKSSRYHEEKRHYWEFKSEKDFLEGDFSPQLSRKRDYYLRKTGKEHNFKETAIFDTQTPIGILEGRTWVNTPEWGSFDSLLHENSPTSDPVNASKLLGRDEVTPEVLKTDATFR